MVVGIIIGIVLLGIGALLLFLRGRSRDKLLEIKSTATSTAAELHERQQGVASEIGPGGFRELVEIEGKVECVEPLTSELSEQPCVWYSMSVEERYEDTYQESDAEGRTHSRTRTGSNAVAGNTRSVRFAVRDATGTILVAPQNAAIEGNRSVDRFEPASGVSGMLRFGSFSFPLSNTPGGRRVLGYHYSEQLIPIGEQVYVIGEAGDGTGELIIESPEDEEKPFVISVRSEKEITKGLEEQAAIQGWSGFGLIAVGLALIVASIAGAFG